MVEVADRSGTPSRAGPAVVGDAAPARVRPPRIHLVGGARVSSPEVGHPGPCLLHEHPWPYDAHAFPRPEVPHVVGHEEWSAGADSRSENRDILCVGKIASPFPILGCGLIDSYGHRAEKLLEERHGLRELHRKVGPDFFDDRLGEHEGEEADLPEDQDRVTRARAGQEAGDQDVGVEADRDRLSLPGPARQDPSATAYGPVGDAPSPRPAVAPPGTEG